MDKWFKNLIFKAVKKPPMPVMILSLEAKNLFIYKI